MFRANKSWKVQANTSNNRTEWCLNGTKLVLDDSHQMSHPPWIAKDTCSRHFSLKSLGDANSVTLNRIVRLLDEHLATIHSKMARNRCKCYLIWKWLVLVHRAVGGTMTWSLCGLVTGLKCGLLIESARYVTLLVSSLSIAIANEQYQGYP
jgi:hypothetical protein